MLTPHAPVDTPWLLATRLLVASAMSLPATSTGPRMYFSCGSVAPVVVSFSSVEQVIEGHVRGRDVGLELLDVLAVEAVELLLQVGRHPGEVARIRRTGAGVALGSGTASLGRRRRSGTATRSG